MEFYKYVLCLIAGYALGCFQTAYIVGRVFGKIDVREHGSGNAGMTNVTRVMGTKFGALVFVADIIKASVAFLVCAAIFGGSSAFFAGENGALPGLIAGLGAVIGHNFPVFLGFRGGKGIAASIGVIFCFDWRVALIAFLVGFIGVAVTRYISLASLLITGLFPLLALVFGYPVPVAAVALVFTGLAYYKHRENIKKLINGTERKFVLFTRGQL